MGFIISFIVPFIVPFLRSFTLSFVAYHPLSFMLKFLIIFIIFFLQLCHFKLSIIHVLIPIILVFFFALSFLIFIQEFSSLFLLCFLLLAPPHLAIFLEPDLQPSIIEFIQLSLFHEHQPAYVMFQNVLMVTDFNSLIMDPLLIT